MNYAKLIDGDILQFAPNPIIIGDRQIGNPPAALLLEQGYKPVVYNDPPRDPPDGYDWQEVWTENEDSIQQRWVLEQVPYTEEEALVRYSNELTGASDETLVEATETLIKLKMEVH